MRKRRRRRRQEREEKGGGGGGEKKKNSLNRLRGLIFQPVFASLPYTQTCTYNNDTTTT